MRLGGGGNGNGSDPFITKDGFHILDDFDAGNQFAGLGSPSFDRVTDHVQGTKGMKVPHKILTPIAATDDCNPRDCGG